MWTLRVGKRAHHIAHLVGDVFQPRLDGFRSRDHSGDLGTDDWLVCQRLSESFPLVNPL